METTDILGVKINKVTLDQAIKEVEKFLLNNEQYYIVTPNPEFLMAGQRDKEFKKILNEADLAIPDGIGLLWAATIESSKFKACLKCSKRYQKVKCLKLWLWLKGLMYGLALIIYPKVCQKVLPERVTGIDLVLRVGELCEEKKYSIYLLGGKDGIACACALRLKQLFPKLNIAGFDKGLKIKLAKNYKLVFSEKENEKLLQRINQAKPDILLVAFGQQKQEKWIYQNLKKIPTVKIAMGVGGTFDFIAGTTIRAPFLFQKIGLEWFWRLMRQPWRFNRITTATLRFVKAVIDERKKQA